MQGLRENRSVPFRISGGTEVGNCKEAEWESVEKFAAACGEFGFGILVKLRKTYAKKSRLEITSTSCFEWVAAISNRGSAY
jgi:hypothetical protein